MTYILVADTPEDVISFVVERLAEKQQRFIQKANESNKQRDKDFYIQMSNVLANEAVHLKELKVISTEEDKSVQLSSKAWDELEHGDRVISHLRTKGTITLLDDKHQISMKTEEESPLIHITWENGKKSVQCHADLDMVRWLGKKK
jgi:hypothetical protein